jgi:hypothetical protein
MRGTLSRQVRVKVPFMWGRSAVTEAVEKTPEEAALPR